MTSENPRQEADTPRVPDLWWSPTQGTWTLDETGAYVAMQPHTPSGLSEELPFDAVKLGDVEALRAEPDRWRDANGRANARVAELARERDALRAEIAEARRILGAESDESLVFLAGTVVQRLDDVRRERDAAERERDAAARVLAAHLDCVGNLERERDALRADIRVVLDSRSGALRMGIVYANESALIKALRLILDREQLRQEP